jgi:hypothetical protein
MVRNSRTLRSSHPSCRPLCKPHRLGKPKPRGVLCASLLEKLPQACSRLLPDCAACGLLDRRAHHIPADQQGHQHFFDTPYYVTPNAVVREAIRNKGVAALGRVVLAKRERVIALEPYDKGLLGTTLRCPYEVRKAEDYFCDLPEVCIVPNMLRLAELILDSKAAEFDPTSFRDRYDEALLAHPQGQAGQRCSRAQADAPGDESDGGAAP